MSKHWILPHKENKMSKYRLFCLPYAGTGASLYAQWQQYMDDKIEICCIQLPGRENRRKEHLCGEPDTLIDAIAEEMKEYLDKPFAVFGYSMGGILAYELTMKIYEKFHVKPVKLFMSASSTFREKKETEVSEMDEPQLMDYMKRSGGVPMEILQDSVYRKEYFPIIQNDYRLVEQYRFPYKKVPCEIVAFASTEDKEVSYENVRLMQFFTPKFRLYPMKGNHFFIRKEYKKMEEIVSREMLCGA